MGFRRPVTIERTSLGTIDENGRYQKGTTGTLTIQASVQPLSIREQSTIVGPDGARNVAYVKIYTDAPLIPQSAASGQGEATKADVVRHLGRRFLVIQCDAYQSGVISHYRAYAKEVLADDDT
nr:MAG TPA: Minor capsid protein [Caudoviricetes sp.]